MKIEKASRRWSLVMFGSVCATLADHPAALRKEPLADDCARTTEYNMYHFSVCASMGETCRSTDPDAKSIRDHTNNPDFLPGEVILNLLQPKMDKEEGRGGYRAVLVNGFPRRSAGCLY
ncbi:uncharacterized protein CIMG_08997 [Coccidioides immitis RS]|uniref:Uncharacterized protein n=4 Tax=Coccidioides immitis TaxID=5501 RepID=J3K1E8_COCIM|nr:uncharacterized protein CIMG_08997 [Coccidioides immitis RS]EAS27793.3 hypothetical protein CIMG_08997 [Coccidioides immitis RS]KMP08579.1 hypothetical protein CIRG_08260 [Coccidioides immitis RMSCC 2394]KMU78580.1 hypothetical protein CISG_01620 [Coccidioides immitis RMSCC 3703]KMU87394.1 hypothetical protein CIHG_05188 [Coccidioides immitis H538.4]